MGVAVDKRALIELLERPIGALGYELVDLDVRTGGRGLLRIYIDSEDGVRLSDCEAVSRQIGALLDVEDPLPGSYVLEVSSPGLDRRLRTAEHFARYTDEEVKIQLSRPQDGRRRFRGRLRGLEGDTVLIEVDGTLWRLAVDNIAVATLVPRDMNGTW
jgi:ribosome maturation factor RimP